MSTFGAELGLGQIVTFGMSKNTVVGRDTGHPLVVTPTSYALKVAHP